jgi:hypothetical protein
MTAITHPLAGAHRVVTVAIAAVVLVGLSVALILAISTAGSSSLVSNRGAARNPVESRFVGTVNSGPDNPSRLTSVGTVNSRPDNPSRVSPSLCRELANVADGPEAARLAMRIAAVGSC